MPYNWGPHYIVPSPSLKTYSGNVLLRESFDEQLLQRELEALNLPQQVVRVTNPWYYHKKGSGSWLKIGESDNVEDNFAVMWNTASLENGDYEVLGLMHVYVKKGAIEKVVARQNIVTVTIKN